MFSIKRDFVVRYTFIEYINSFSPIHCLTKLESRNFLQQNYHHCDNIEAFVL